MTCCCLFTTGSFIPGVAQVDKISVKDVDCEYVKCVFICKTNIDNALRHFHTNMYTYTVNLYRGKLIITSMLLCF